MKVTILEEEKGKLKLELKGSTKSFAHTISGEVWENGKEAAAIREHPFMVEPAILVKAPNPRKALENAGKAVIEQCDELKEAYKHAGKQ
jgi:DNA-directed RNA polymerase subunit L